MENQRRVNYGRAMHDRKGLLELHGSTTRTVALRGTPDLGPVED
ncbi:hypothetical protein [Streptomyces antnestii]|nr:hypothetical protein [Streptomyces sp. San01]